MRSAQYAEVGGSNPLAPTTTPLNSLLFRILVLEPRPPGSRSVALDVQSPCAQFASLIIPSSRVWCNEMAWAMDAAEVEAEQSRTTPQTRYIESWLSGQFELRTREMAYAK